MYQSRAIRFGLGMMLMLAAAFGFMGLAQIAQADTVTSEELLPSDFGEATGLGTGDLQDTIGYIIRAALGFLGIIAVVIILIGGFKWMTAQGSEDKVQEAKKLIIAGIIGLAIILSAYAIASFVIEQLVTATTQ